MLYVRVARGVGKHLGLASCNLRPSLKWRPGSSTAQLFCLLKILASLAYEAVTLLVIVDLAANQLIDGAVPSLRLVDKEMTGLDWATEK